MNNAEKLEAEINQSGIELIHNYIFDSVRIKGLYCNGAIALNRSVKSIKEKACILAEELGHHYTTSGNIIDQSKAENRQQEYKARLWAYDRQVGLLGIVNAYEAGCQNSYDMAEYLDVTEAFLQDALICYKQKYGLYKTIDKYVIYFEPALGVMKYI